MTYSSSYLFIKHVFKYAFPIPIFIGVWMLLAIPANAQSNSSYNWGNPKYAIEQEDSLTSGIVLLDYRSIHFNKVKIPMFSVNKKNRVVHRQIYLNVDSVVEQFNEIKLPIGQKEKVKRLQIRIIRSAQQKIEVSPDAIQYIDSLKEDKGYLVYTVKELQPGDIFEYLYEIEMVPNIYGSEPFQTYVPIRKAALYLTSDGVDFELKGYNGAKIKGLSDRMKRNSYSCELKNIPAFEEEYYAANYAERVRVDYIAKGVDWNTLAEVVMLNVSFHPKKIKKKVNKLVVNKLKLFKYDTKTEKIIAIENYIETNYELIEEDKNSLTDLKYVLENKQANENGITYLYAALLNAAKIDFEVVACSDRFDRIFDRDFPSPNNLSHFLFYFSDLKQFLTPFPYGYSFGVVPPYLLNQQGLSSTGVFTKGKGLISNHRFVDIKNSSLFESFVFEDIKVHFDESQDAFISMVYDYTGYRAQAFAAGYNQAKVEDRLAYIRDYLPIDSTDELPSKIKINGQSDLDKEISYDNVTIYAELSKSVYTEINDDGTISFKIGKLIGAQMQLEDEERTRDIELDYAVHYDRLITIFTTDKQQFVNLDELNFSQYKIDQNNKGLMGFDVEVEEERNKISIAIEEYYNFLKLDKSYYNAFQAVINAAFDFSEARIKLKEK